MPRWAAARLKAKPAVRAKSTVVPTTAGVAKIVEIAATVVVTAVEVRIADATTAGAVNIAAVAAVPVVVVARANAVVVALVSAPVTAVARAAGLRAPANTNPPS